MLHKHPKIVKMIPLFFILVVLILMYAGSVQRAERQELNDRVTKENNTYVRAITCIVSVVPGQRTPEYVQNCYDQAEKAHGYKIDHYGHAK